MLRNPIFKSGHLTVDYDHVETRGVLAGAYLPRHLDQGRGTLTHLIFIGPPPGYDELRTGCRQPVDHMVDMYGSSLSESAARPTCPTCAQKWEKIPSDLRGRRPEGEMSPNGGRKLVTTSPSPPETNPGFQLGLDGRSKYTQFSWSRAVALAKKEKESGSSNALRVVLQILRWDPQGKQVDYVERDAAELTEAKQEARAWVAAGGSMAEVRGVASRIFAQRGFGDKTVWNLLTVEPAEEEQGMSPNGGYYVWVLDAQGNPLLEGPYGPHELESARSLARIGATKGKHDRAVSLGLRPTEKSFQIVGQYKAGSGERVL